MSFVWGIAGIDRSDFVVWEPGNNRGTAVFRDSFDLSTKEAQDFILGTCQALRDRTCSQAGCTQGKLTLPGEVDCWFEEFQTWYTVRAVAAAHAAEVCHTPRVRVSQPYIWLSCRPRLVVRRCRLDQRSTPSCSSSARRTRSTPARSASWVALCTSLSSTPSLRWKPSSLTSSPAPCSTCVSGVAAGPLARPVKTHQRRSAPLFAGV